MENELQKKMIIPASACDAGGVLGIPGVFDCFMDLAAEHASSLGVGYSDMRDRGCCWVAVRTRVRLYRRPEMGELISAETWPGKPGLAKSDRFYRLTFGEETLAEGRTEWAVQDIATGAIRRTDSYGWPDIETRSDRVCAGPFTRMKPLTDGDSVKYTVRSTDIDTGRHMNNVAYIRMLLGTFTVSELSAMDVVEAEVSYRRACFEGEDLLIRKKELSGIWQLDVIRQDGECAVQALLRRGT